MIGFFKVDWPVTPDQLKLYRLKIFTILMHYVSNRKRRNIFALINPVFWQPYFAVTTTLKKEIFEHSSNIQADLRLETSENRTSSWKLCKIHDRGMLTVILTRNLFFHTLSNCCIYVNWWLVAETTDKPYKTLRPVGKFHGPLE